MIRGGQGRSDSSIGATGWALILLLPVLGIVYGYIRILTWMQ